MNRKQQQSELNAALQQAVALHRQGRLAEADRAYAAVLARDPENFDALNLLGLLKLQSGRAADAADLLARALKRNPRSPEALSNMAVALTTLSRHEEALQHYDRLLVMQPGNIDVLYNRGVVLTSLQRHDEALAAYRKVLERNPKHVEALFNQANLLAQRERYAEALADYDRVVALAPNVPDVLNNRGNVLGRLGRYEDALGSFDRALAIKPDYVDALCNKATALKQLGRAEQALSLYEQALARAPNHVNSLFNSGNMLVDRNRLAEALARYERALMIAPGHADALSGRARVLLRLNRMDDAIASVDRALALKPGDAELLNLRGHIYERYPKLALALRDYGAVLASAPDNVAALAGRAACLVDGCVWDLAGAAIDRVKALVDAGHPVNPMLLLRINDDPARQLASTRDYLKAHCPAPTLALKDAAPRAGRIHIAYLSPDFRNHALAYLVPELFERHDREKFEVVAISFGPNDASPIRSRIVGAVDHFHDALFMSDHEVANLMREIGVDIAVDLAAHTAHARFGVFAYRAASIQVNYLGFCGTSGADFIDYIIADPVVVPFDQQPFYSEAVVHLPHSFMVNDSKQPVLAAPTRREAGLPEDAFVFCCFNKSYKYTAPVFDVWMRLLRQVDGSVLWLSGDNDLAIENLHKAAGRAGIDAKRVIIAPRVPSREDHLARYAAADLFLDTLPYNAHSTASDALWAGLPLVTCLGKSFAGRVGASLVSAVGLPELVTHSLAEYEALALQLAGDRELLGSIKRRLAAQRLTQPLFDTARFTRHIERSYATMSDRYRAGVAPERFAVAPLD